MPTQVRYGRITVVTSDHGNAKAVEQISKLLQARAAEFDTLMLSGTNLFKSQEVAQILSPQPTTVMLEGQDVKDFLVTAYHINPTLLSTYKNAIKPNEMMVLSQVDPHFYTFFKEFTEYVRSGVDKITQRIFEYTADKLAQRPDDPQNVNVVV